MMTAELVRQLFRYNSKTGELVRIKSGNKGCKRHDGYLLVGVNYKTYLVHRLVWLHQTGEWPKGVLDHINHNPSDNRMENLRDVTQVENQLNRKGLNKNNSRGFAEAKHPYWRNHVHPYHKVKLVRT